MGIKKGTKLTDCPKNRIIRVRVDAETDRRLRAVSEHLQLSMSDVIRRGIDRQFEEIKK